MKAGACDFRFSLFEASVGSNILIAKGAFEGLGGSPRFQVCDGSERPIADEMLDSGHENFDHRAAFEYLVAWMRENYADRMALSAVGHHITHGGAECAEPTLLTPEVLQRLEALSSLAPRQQRHNLAGVKAVSQVRPDLPQIGCFDTAFHRGRSASAERFGLPDGLLTLGIRRWGFHGLSFESVIKALGESAPHLAAGRIIVAYLGDSASLCAIQGGHSVDTTMSFSTLDGLPMATRCGSLDPDVILHLLRHMSADELETLLYEQSGLLGISGISGDVRVLLASKDPRAAEAIDFLVYRIVSEIGSLTAALGGLDALVFTAGIGVNSAAIRSRICRRLGWLGLALDPGANERHERCVSFPGRSPSVWIIPSDEEQVIAAHTWKIVSLLPHRLSYWEEAADDCPFRENRAQGNHTLSTR